MPPAMDLARRFADAVIALRAIHDFDAWIGQFWTDRCTAPDCPARGPAPRGTEDFIVWHETEGSVFGFLPGRDGCFCIPRDTALPDFAFATGRADAPFWQDVVISAAMREEIHPPGS